MEHIIFTMAFFVIPLLVWGCDLSHIQDIPERHHSSHDTFAVSSRAVSAIVTAIFVSAVLAIALGILSMFHYIRTDVNLIYGGLLIFELALVAVWAMESRLRVNVFGDHLRYVPPVGSPVNVALSDIDSMELSRMHCLRIETRHGRRLTILPMLDTFHICQWVERARLAEGAVAVRAEAPAGGPLIS